MPGYRLSGLGGVSRKTWRGSGVANHDQGIWRDQIASFSHSSNLRLFLEHLELANDPGFPGTNNRPPGSAQASPVPATGLQRLNRRPPTRGSPHLITSQRDQTLVVPWSLPSLHGAIAASPCLGPGLIPSGHASAARSAILMAFWAAKSCILGQSSGRLARVPMPWGRRLSRPDADCRKSAFRCEPDGIDNGPTQSPLSSSSLAQA